MSEEAEEGSLMMLRDEEELEWPDLEGEEMVTKIKMKDYNIGYAHLECEEGESELKELPRNFLPTPGDLFGSCLFLNASVSLLKSSRSCLLRPWDPPWPCPPCRSSGTPKGWESLHKIMFSEASVFHSAKTIKGKGSIQEEIKLNKHLPSELPCLLN